MQNDKLLLHRIRGSEWVLCNIDNIAVGCGMVGWKIMLAIERRNEILSKLKEEKKELQKEQNELKEDQKIIREMDEKTQHQ